jgi:hypothetical protein
MRPISQLINQMSPQASDGIPHGVRPKVRRSDSDSTYPKTAPMTPMMMATAVWVPVSCSTTRA